MSEKNLTKYPISIENCEIKEKTLQFTVINNTPDNCKITINNKQIENTKENKINISYDISDYFIDKFNIKVEAGDKFIFKTIPYDLSNMFTNLKKTLIGKDGYFFLVNDRNNEIRQHYDSNYHCNLDINLFRESTLSKKSYLENKGINYALFVVPDKSITLQDKLPFKTRKPYRHTDLLDDIVIDLNQIIEPEDMFKNDTHISSKSSLKIVSYMTSLVDNVPFDEVYDKLEECTHFERRNHLGDLFNFRNWSYDRDELFHENKYVCVDVVCPDMPISKLDINVIPEEFRHISHRESYYYRNDNSISDKRAVILHDSSTLLLIDALTCYYREVFFYWDHWFFNDKLIDWFKPDDVLEIRTERFLDKPQYPIVNDDYMVKYPVTAKLEKLSVDDKSLSARILLKDYRQLPVHTHIMTFIDDVLVCEEDYCETYYDFTYDLSGYSNGDHSICFKIKSKYKYREVYETFVLEDSLLPLFMDLKLTFRGLDDTFFMVNDKTNELRQHYDKMFVSKFNLKRFITSFNSKKSYLERLNINYGIFVIPDKSVVLCDYIPFKKDSVYRHMNFLDDYLVDLLPIMCVDDYLLNDTNVSMCAGLKLVSYMLSCLHDESADVIRSNILGSVSVVDGEHKGNLFTNKSWSYPDMMDLHDKYYSVDTKLLEVDSVCNVDLEDIPFRFRKFSSSKSQYFINENSLTSLRVLVLCDDSISPLISSLTCYYREVFLYFDKWFFSKDLVDWFDPDDILEIRGERTLENAQYQLVSIEDNFVIPVTSRIEKFELNEGILSIRIVYDDLRHLPVKSSCVVFFDSVEVDNVGIDGVLDVSYPVVDDLDVVEVHLLGTDVTKSNIIRRSLGD